MKKLGLYSLYLFIFNILALCGERSVLHAKTQIGCVHPELCILAQKSLANENYDIKNIVTMIGDPHEFEPNPQEVKKLISTPILITGPSDLSPWARKINYQRSKLKFNDAHVTFILSLTPEDYALYKNHNREALSHFWLYPKIYCLLKSQFEKLAKEKNLKTKISQNESCQTEANKIENKIKITLDKLAKLKIPLILTHDALLPLLKFLGRNELTVVAIKGSGHHQEATVETVKAMYEALKFPKAIWIQEDSIKVPANILNKKKVSDHTIYIDTATSSDVEMFSILKKLNSKLEEISN